MREGNRLRNSAAKAGRRHREEQFAWAFELLIYVALMRQAEPFKFTIGILAFLLAWPIFLRSAWQ